MIRRFFGPIPFSIFILLSATLGYFIHSYMPSHNRTSIIKIENIELKDTTKASKPLSISKLELMRISEKLSNLMKSKKQLSTPLISFLENHPATAGIYPTKISLSVSKDEKEILLDMAFTPKLYTKDVSVLVIDEAKNLITEYFKHELENKKSSAVSVVTEKKKNILPTTKKDDTPEIVMPEKVKVAPKVENNKVPPEIANNLAKFKEFKAQEEAKLKELQDQLSSLPPPSSTPLVMLTSNLQKNYEMQLIVLNGKKDWIKNSDPEQIKKIESEKAVVFEKLKNENIKLRDESYYFKGQQDKALREKHTHLLNEEKSKKDVLDALNELEKSLLKPQEVAETTTKVIDEAALAKKEAEEAEAQRVKIAQMEVEALNAYIAEIDASLESLNSNGITSSAPVETTMAVAYYKNPLIASNLGILLLTLLLISGIVFGSSNKVSSAKVVADILGAPMLGSIPVLPNEGLENAKHKKLTDAIDAITDSLTKTLQEKDIKTLNILSPNSSEGRTQLTGMLALSFNLKKNMKVIALDTCFNNPKLADFLELKTRMQPNEDGLISYFKHLIETKEISETDNNQWLAKLVKPCVRNGVFVISPGAGSFTDSNSFNSRVILTMHEGLGKYVDLIISDTPPLNSSLNFVTKVLAENSTGNILLIKKGVYTKKELESLRRKYSSINLLGFILK